MRFFENGPSIPPFLIEQRALGNVIVFCGAGISRRAGLPDFGGLTERLITKLGAEKAAKALAANDSFDRVFNALVTEFGAQEIDRRIYDALKTPRKPDLENHRIVLDLSRNLIGVPQIVTTNFDLLFESVDRKIGRFVPPSLPDLNLGAPLQGIVYLHGRLMKPNAQARAGYVISSADFGRAYLAQGWATRFVKALRERYTIVLLGYSADDPPMRYLLEGLHSEDGVGYRSPIYTFAPGDLDDMEEKWRDRGVTPIAYDPVDGAHSGLWDSLRAWASASVEPDKWDAQVLALAKNRPSTLKPHERGQVAQLVSTKAGAKLFANMEPAPPAEWLCVLDQNTRYAKPRATSYEDDAPKIDPLDLFGVDDDPERPPEKPNLQAPTVGTNYLRWMYGDTSFPERTGLAGWNPEWSNQLPERLHHLARWFGRIAHQPAAVWWASGWRSLHPGITWFVNRRLRDANDFSQPARKFWQLYLEAAPSPLIGDHDLRWYEFKEIVKQAGWSNFALREFERLVQPRAAFQRSPYTAPHPPEGDWQDLRLRDLIEVKVRVLDRHGDTLDVPTAELSKVVELVRRSLVLTAELLEEVETVWWQAPTLYPSKGDGEVFHGRKEQYFLWFFELFSKLSELSMDAAREEIRSWDRNERYFFGKLGLRILADGQLLPPGEAFAWLMEVKDRIFFDSHNRRELLFAVKERWASLSVRQRRSIEKRIIKGATRREGVSARTHRQRRMANAASMLRWLEMQECTLTAHTANQMPELKAADPDWNDEWARGVDESFSMRSGSVETVKDQRGLDELPVDKIIAAAQRLTERPFHEFREYQPFLGLAESNPRKALSALRREAKQGGFPVNFWETLISGWPVETSSRLRWLMAHSLAALPSEVAIELRHYVPGWVRKHIEALSTENRTEALEIFDGVLAPYLNTAPQFTRSGIGTTTIGGVVQPRSEVSINKAINSPIGKLTEALFSVDWKATKAPRPPKFFRDRLQSLFEVPGLGAGHAACVVSARLGWLDHYYPAWVRSALIPIFDLAHPLAEAAWHGRAYDQNGLSLETWKSLLPTLLALLSGDMSWALDETEYQQHVRGLVWLSQSKNGKAPLIARADARAILVALDDRGRAEALNTLVRIASENAGWSSFVKSFIEETWPRQLRYRSEETSRAFARLVESAGEHFPEAVETVLPFLRAVPHVDMITYRLSKEIKPDEKDFARTFPAATLKLLDALIAEDRSSMPYELSKVLEIIVEADPSLRQTVGWRRLQDLVS
jgi:hypothetical protein